VKHTTFCEQGEEMKARIRAVSEAGCIEEAAHIVLQGGLVAFPTETVYGLGVDAHNPVAVAKVFEVKRRPSFNPIIVHIADFESASRYGDLEKKAARDLMSRFWPGPLTIVAPKKKSVPPLVTAGLPNVALRMPDNSTALALIRAVGRGIAAPSANPFGYVSPTEARHVEDQLADHIDMILDGGKCSVGLESTVVDLVGPKPCILRFGSVTLEEIQKAIGPVDRSPSSLTKLRSPGQLRCHYATVTQMQILEDGEEARTQPGEKVGLLAFDTPDCPERYASVEVLSPCGDLREAAANLFSAMRRLDALGLDRIVAQPVPEEGLGIAIMDRLKRCAMKSN
jgi:L-threonylcarbamoyladenylate synthase